MVARRFRDITVYLRDSSFSSVRELESSITTFLALPNAQPTRYVWSAKGEDILNKIQRPRGDDLVGMRDVNFERVHQASQIKALLTYVFIRLRLSC